MTLPVEPPGWCSRPNVCPSSCSAVVPTLTVKPYSCAMPRARMRAWAGSLVPRGCTHATTSLALPALAPTSAAVVRLERTPGR